MENYFKRHKKLILIFIICILLISGYFSYSFILNKNFFQKFSFFNPQNGRVATYVDNTATSPEENYTSLPATSSEGEYETSQESYQTIQLSEPSNESGLKILKNGTMSIITDKGKFFETWQKVILTTKSLSGNVTNSNYYKQADYYSGFLTVLIPSDQFDNFSDSISKLGKVLSLNVSTKDVTGEYVDLSSKLNVLEEQKTLLLSWLKSAKTIDEMLKLRNEVENIQTEIETIKGRMNYISFHTDFSEISINISETEEIYYTNGFFTPLLEWVKKLFNTLLFSLFGLLIIFAFILPWAVIGFSVYKFVSRRKK